MGKGGQTPANPSQCPSCHRPHLGLPACCPPTHFAASVASLLCSSLPRTSVAISGLSFRALPPACAVSSSVSFLVSRLLSAPGRLADALRCATRTKLSQAEPRPSPSGCSRSSEDWQPEESFGTGASRTTRPDSTPEDQIVSSSGPNLGLGALHPSLKGHPSTVGARCVPVPADINRDDGTRPTLASSSDGRP